MLQKVRSKKIRSTGDFVIVASKYNARYVDAMVRAAKSELLRAGGKVQVFRVPGAYEIPVVAARLGRSQMCSAIICLGVILRGAILERPIFGKADFFGARRNFSARRWPRRLRPNGPSPRGGLRPSRTGERMGRIGSRVD